ncbi:uncharacterized protein BJX67DRAFT_346708 [Aspergillus lucknowensis]|uniref:Uncharacterized protein n=1 Tax=Aspergillus lucknowensis TaxID=176173 RepID=A0ABR4M029_9EURO
MLKMWKEGRCWQMLSARVRDKWSTRPRAGVTIVTEVWGQILGREVVPLVPSMRIVSSRWRWCRGVISRGSGSGSAMSAVRVRQPRGRASDLGPDGRGATVPLSRTCGISSVSRILSTASDMTRFDTKIASAQTFRRRYTASDDVSSVLGSNGTK